MPRRLTTSKGSPMNTRKPIVLVSLIAAALLAATGGILARAEPEKRDNRLIALQKERLAAAKAMHDVRLANWKAESITIDKLVESSHEIMKARLPLAKTRLERLAAYGDHLDWLRKDEKRRAALHEAGEPGGEADALQKARINRLKIKIAMERERLGSGQPGEED